MNARARELRPRSLLWEALRRPVGPHHRGWLAFGWLLLLVLILEAVSGCLLAVYYRASSEAPESLRFLMREVDWGWLVRGLHRWGSQALLAIALAAGLRELVARGWRGSRGVLWLLGLLVVLVLFASDLTGMLLRWDEPAYQTTRAVLARVEALPGVGAPLAAVLGGATKVAPATIGRVYAAHVFLLPFVLGAAVVAAVWYAGRRWRSRGGAA
jgi:quinol-cytochrome oxidoreductase complex cytochrome b subunit